MTRKAKEEKHVEIIKKDKRKASIVKDKKISKKKEKVIKAPAGKENKPKVSKIKKSGVTSVVKKSAIKSIGRATPSKRLLALAADVMYEPSKKVIVPAVVAP
jgi:hypothetical protein